MAVQSTQIDTTSDSKALMFGNSDGTFTPASSTRGLYDGMSSRPPVSI